MTRFTVALLLALAPAAFAQTPAPPAPPAVPQAPPPPTTFISDQSAQETREQLRELLRQLPPSVGEVLALDPSLLGQPDYLAAYPMLVSFIAQHPDVRRNPSFYFGERNFREQTPGVEAVRALSGIAAGFAVLLGFVAFLVVFAWIVRQVIDYRRWNRMTRTQTEVHTKLLDRLTSSDELLAYIQSPAGRRFLESTPIPLDAAQAPSRIAAPINRILWAVQVGVILVAAGVGFLAVRGNIIQELSQAFFVLGTVTVALGIGFVVSAGASYLLSSHLGLMAPSRSES